MTDANVVVGHLPPRLLGGEMALDVEAARAAVQTIADAMGLGRVEEAAEGILAIVNENMAGALRLVSVQRGHDPREFALVAFGGAGPLHANAVAKLMGSFPVIVPPAPGPALRDRRPRRRLPQRVRPDAHPPALRGRRRRRSRGILDELGGRARRLARERGHRRASARSITFIADMRYHGQGYEIPVAIDPAEIRSAASPTSRSASTASTSSSTGSACPDTAAEIVNLRAVGFGAVPKPELPVGDPGGADASAAVVDTHEIVFDGEQRATTIYDRAKLAPRQRASTARRSSPSSTRPPSSSPATRPRST